MSSDHLGRSIRALRKLARPLKPVLKASRRAAAAVPLRIIRQIRRELLRRTRWPILRATAADEASLRARLAEALVESPLVHGPLISAIVPTRNGLHHLERLLPALEGLAYRDLEVVVIDNASDDGTLEHLGSLRPRFALRVIRNTVNASFSEACNQGVAEGRGEYLLFLNNDTEPAGVHVIGHMVQRMLDDPSTGAVASRLIYPRRDGPLRGPAHHAPDLTLQHRGTAFETEAGMAQARNQGGGEDPLGPLASEAREVQLATAACLLVRRSAIDAVGGFSSGYEYGQEDVDLCLKVRAAGWQIVYEPQATFWHHESATQRAEDAEARRARQQGNRKLLGDRWGPRIAREVLLDKLGPGRGWAASPLHVGITLTKDDPAAGWGDWYTAHELGDALEALGWSVSYLERAAGRWYRPPASLDVVIALLDSFDVRRVPEGIVRVAWVRNWTDRWIDRPWFDEYDLVLASSRVSKDLIDRRSIHEAALMPLATNPRRFAAGGAADPVVDVVITANRWGEARLPEIVAPRLAAAGRSVAIFGKGWQQAPAVAGHARGPVPYDDLPHHYASAAIVLDDTATPTLPYGALNSRVFDALASGALVVTDNVIGARELFGDLLPAASDPEALVALADRWLADADGRAALVAQLRAIVLDRHTYAHRASQLHALLLAWVDARRIDIAVGPPTWAVAHTWGDYHFGRALQRALRRRGFRGRLRLRDAWDRPEASVADAVIHVFGLAASRVRPAQLSVLWIISHPDLATADVLEGQDFVFAASDRFAAELAARSGRAVLPLHQATDPDRFRPTPGGPRHELLFVANSRRVRRPIVEGLTPTDRDFAVYGHNWTDTLIDRRYLRGEHVPNEQLAAYYSAAEIVLNDHWADMASSGFLSNRLYDASASGAFVLSDWVDGIDAEFDGGIVTFREIGELRPLVERLLAEPETRAEHARRARGAAIARHTFGHRVETLLETIGPALAAHPARIEQRGRTDGSTPAMAGLVVPPETAARGPLPATEPRPC